MSTVPDRMRKESRDITSSVPCTIVGTIGTPAATARTKGPFLNGRSAWLRPRVPSGNTTTEAPARMRSAATRYDSNADFRFSRSIGIVPTARAVNPHTKSNWDGTGVLPELAVPADDALRAAQIRLLENLIRDGEADLKEDRIRRKEALEKDKSERP